MYAEFLESNQNVTAFFVKTEEKAVGPFSGIELREAAMAGILRPDTKLAGGANGPWVLAKETGLFSEKNMPLPHPPGTAVASFQVRGGVGGLKGPFKLRELIGFVTRGLIPADSMIRSEKSPKWIPIRRINMLDACLDGHLVLIDADGKVVRRATESAKNQHGFSPASMAAARAPAKQTVKDSELDESYNKESFGESTTPEATKGALVATRGAATDEDDEESQEADSTDKWWKQRLSISKWVTSISGGRSGRWIVASVCSIVLLVGIATAFTKYRNVGFQKEQIVGDWIAIDSSYGVSFQDDGTCVVFDTRSGSWTGDYEWTQRNLDDSGFADIEPFTSHIAKPADDHAVRPIVDSDGYLRLRGHTLQSTQIGAVEMPDCFVRMFGEQLRIGYLSTVIGDAKNKTMYGAWMTLNPSPLIGVEAMLDLASLDIEPPPEVGFSTVKAPHISEVVSGLAEAYSTGQDVSDLGSVCYSAKVNAKYLLETYGVPNEARALQKSEVAAMSEGHDFDGSQMVRYGSLKLVLSADGTLQYATITQ